MPQPPPCCPPPNLLLPQGMLGKKQLEHVLQRLGLMPESTTLPQAFPEVSGWTHRVDVQSPLGMT
jgi:hypothetical protein